MSATSYVTGSIRICTTPAFWTYISQRTSVICTSKEMAAEQLRHLCGIESRRELATNEAARMAYIEVVNDFNRFIARTRIR